MFSTAASAAVMRTSPLRDGSTLAAVYFTEGEEEHEEKHEW